MAAGGRRVPSCSCQTNMGIAGEMTGAARAVDIDQLEGNQGRELSENLEII